MRAVRTWFIGLGVGSVAATAAAVDAGQGGSTVWDVVPAVAVSADDADTSGGALELWPAFAPASPAAPPLSPLAPGGLDLSASDASGDEPDVARPVFFNEVSGSAGNEPPFAKGTWSLQLTGSYYTTVSGSDVTLGYGTVSVGYYYADTWAVDLSVSGYALEEDDQSEGVAASLGLNLRKHFLVRDPFSVYIDGGVGIIRADGEFPAGGTNTNFTLQGGLGATWRLTESMHVVGGARWFHISNARRHGEDGNASTDGVAVYGGLMWTW